VHGRGKHHWIGVANDIAEAEIARVGRVDVIETGPLDIPPVPASARPCTPVLHELQASVTEDDGLEAGGGDLGQRNGGAISGGLVGDGVEENKRDEAVQAVIRPAGGGLKVQVERAMDTGDGLALHGPLIPDHEVDVRTTVAHLTDRVRIEE